MNFDGIEKEAEIETGKGRKRKLFNSEDGSKEASKRRMDGDETVAKENGGLPDFKLPVELLAKIISLVPLSQWVSLELVSHSFYAAMHVLWGQLREIRLDEFIFNEEKKPQQVVDAVLKKFLIRAPNVTSISGVSEFFDETTPIRLPTLRLLSKFKHLESIDFSGQKIITARHFAAFMELSESREFWKCVDIDCGIYGKTKNRNAVQPDLNLECFKFNMETLPIFNRFLQVNWSQLKKLVLIDQRASAEEVLSIIRQCTQIVHLEIKIPKCKFLIGNGQVSNDDFMRGVADLENLSVLKIVGNWSCEKALHDALVGLIQDLGRRCITDLALVYCTDEILDAIIDHLRRLRSLDIRMTKCTSESLLRLANEMVHLETLKFRSSSSFIKAAFIRAIVGNISGLRCLHLDYLFINSDDFASLGDFRNLKELRVRGKFVDWVTVKTWTCLGFGSCLESLELALQEDISPEAMGAFFKNMPRLSWLRLRGVTDGILETIADSCPNLVELDLWESPNITPTGIQSIIDRCSRLKILKVVHHSDWFPTWLMVGKYRKITFKSEFDA